MPLIDGKYVRPAVGKATTVSNTSVSSEELQNLLNIAQKNNINLAPEEPKLGKFQRLVAGLNAFQTAPLFQKAIVEEKPIGEAIKSQLQSTKQGLGSAFTGKPIEEPSVTFDDIFNDLIGTPTTKGGKIASKVASIATEVATDPTTYLTFGVGKGVKLGEYVLKSGARPVIKKTAKEVAEAEAKRLVAQGVTTKSVKALTTDIAKTPENLKRALEVITKELDSGNKAFTQFVDKGGIKFGGQTIVPGKAFSPLKNKITAFKKTDTATTVGKLFSRDYGLSPEVSRIKQIAIDTTKVNQQRDIDLLKSIVKPFNAAGRKEITYALEAGEEAIAKLSPDMQNGALQIRSLLDGYKERGLVEGILDGTLDNYVPHVYNNKDADAIIQSLSRANPAKVSSKFRFNQARQVDSIMEAKRLGLEPEEDIANIAADYIQRFNRAEGNSKYLKELTKRVGVQLPDKKALKNPILDIYNTIAVKELDLPAKTAAHVQRKQMREMLESWAKGDDIGVPMTQQKFKELTDFLDIDPKKLQTRDDIKQFADAANVNRVDDLLESAAELPLNEVEIAKVEKAIGEPLVAYSDRSIGDVLLPQSVAADLTKHKSLFVDHNDIGMLLHGYDKFLSFWKGSVTSIFPSFHARNAVSNVAQNFMDIGLDSINPVRQAQAVQIMAGMDGRFVTDLGVEYTYKQLREIAENKNVLTGNFFYTEAGKFVEQQLGDVTTKNVLKKTAAAPGRVGRAIGGQIEDEARLVNFISNLRKGLSVDDAADTTKKFLFDYGNLSAFEKDVMRRAIPFYTWTRKNISLQLHLLATKPGVIGAELKAVQGLGEPISSQERLESLPPWAAEAAGFKGGTDKYGRPLYFTGLGLPIEAFTQTVSLKSAMNMLSPVLKAPIEITTGQDFFRGKPIQEIYKANDVANLINMVNKATGLNTQTIESALDLSSRERNVYVNGTPTGEKETVYSANPYVLYAIRTLPTSRLTNTLGYAASQQDNNFQKFLKLMTGVRAYSFDEEQQRYFSELDQEDKLRSQLERKGLVGTGTYTYEKKK